MSIYDIIARIVMIIVFSSAIGFERQKNRSSAGLKTHTLVGVAATLIAITQVRISAETLAFAMSNPEFAGIVRSDPARLTAQIISGVGFLGAGTIIVTSRTISGLTTAASIWAVAALGIAVGMGYFDIALVAFISIISILFIVKRFVNINTSENVIIKYIEQDNIKEFMEYTFERLHINAILQKYEKAPFGQTIICTATYEIVSHHSDFFDSLVLEFSKNESIVSIQSTNI